MHYHNQNQVNPKHRSKVTAISFCWAFSGFFWDTRFSQKGLIFMDGQKMLAQIMCFTIKNMHAKLLSNWAITFHFIIRSAVSSCEIEDLVMQGIDILREERRKRPTIKDLYFYVQEFDEENILDFDNFHELIQNMI